MDENNNTGELGVICHPTKPWFSHRYDNGPGNEVHLLLQYLQPEMKATASGSMREMGC